MKQAALISGNLTQPGAEMMSTRFPTTGRKKMMDIRTSYIPTEDLGAHPAVRAWSSFCGQPAKPLGVDVLRAPHRHASTKPCVFRIRGLKGENHSIVAKLCLKETARFERLIYKTILPELPLPRLEFYGTVASEDPALDWVFVEDAGDERYSSKLEEHRHLAAEWIATLHTSAKTLPQLQQLPDRGPSHYLKHLRSACRRIDASRSNRVITADQRTVLNRVDACLRSFEVSWSNLDQLCQSMPRTLVHGDWDRKNARFRSAGGHHVLVAFDWETSGRGVPAVDIAWSKLHTSPCCLHVYFAKVRGSWPATRYEDVLRMASVGRIFRAIACIDWDCADLVFEQTNCLTGPMISMQSHLDQIEEASREFGANITTTISDRKAFTLFRPKIEESVSTAKEPKDFLGRSEAPGRAELRDSLLELLGDGDGTDHLRGAEKLAEGVYRLRFGMNGSNRSLIVKRLNPEIAKRNSLVANRWLPAIGLGQNGPPLLRSAAERNGQCVWHIYEDLGDWGLKESSPKLEYVRLVVELVARMHARFAGHPWLAECRLWGGDLGVHFYSTSVRDAIGSLELLKSPHTRMSVERAALRDRLLRRLHRLLDELPFRLEVIEQFAGPETMLHGDLWPQNVFVIPSPEGLRVRMIDWDHASAGPVMYDLSTFLSRFPVGDRLRILDAYREAPETPNWKMPSRKELNLLFETLESARVANCVIWQAIEAGESGASAAFDYLKEIEGWFEALQPLLPV